MGLGDTGLNESYQPHVPQVNDNYFSQLFPKGPTNLVDTLDTLSRIRHTDAVAASVNADNALLPEKIRQLQAGTAATESQTSLRERAFPLEQDLKNAQLKSEQVATNERELGVAKTHLLLDQMQADQGATMRQIKERPEASQDINDILAAPDDPLAYKRLLDFEQRYPWWQDDKVIAARVVDAVKQPALSKQKQDMERDAIDSDRMGLGPLGTTFLRPLMVRNRNGEAFTDVTGVLNSAGESDAPTAAKQMLDSIEKSLPNGISLYDENGGFSDTGKKLVDLKLQPYKARAQKNVANAGGFLAQTETSTDEKGNTTTKTRFEDPGLVRNPAKSGTQAADLTALIDSRRRLESLQKLGPQADEDELAAAQAEYNQRETAYAGTYGSAPMKDAVTTNEPSRPTFDISRYSTPQGLQPSPRKTPPASTKSTPNPSTRISPDGT